ncbi:MAG TPA: isoprenylcysteine carboxylmethyltransferase family protein [Mycobacterium sp.]|jgi:protein-S-isoprenylcysteine O-methyltransferase Ste14
MTQPATAARSRIGGALAFAYGIAAYAFFVVVFLYAIAFVADAWFVPNTIDRGGWGDGEATVVAVVVDVGLLLLFAVQHSVMARAGFKRWWTRFVPSAVERSTYVVAASVCLALLFAFWFPITPTLWDVTAQPWRGVLVGVAMLGWAIAFVSTFLINHFDLFGLRQVFLRLRNLQPSQYSFRTPAFYRIVRHPLYLGFLVAFWFTPTMTVGHALFSVATTGYILIAVQLEERDLIRMFGGQYRDYRKRVPMLVPGYSRRRTI